MFESLDCLINAVSKIDNSNSTSNFIPKNHQNSSRQTNQYQNHMNSLSHYAPAYNNNYSHFDLNTQQCLSNSSNSQQQQLQSIPSSTNKSSLTSSPPPSLHENEFVHGLPILNGQVNSHDTSSASDGYSSLSSMNSMEIMKPSISQQQQQQNNQIIYQIFPNSLRQKASRKRISLQQTECLQSLFDNGMHFPGRDLRERLATKLNLTCRTIQVWFQNRRQTSRKGGNISKTNTAILDITEEDIDDSASQEEDFITTVPIPKEKVSIRWMKPIEFTTDVNNGSAQFRQQAFIDYSTEKYEGIDDVDVGYERRKYPPSPSLSPLPFNIPQPLPMINSSHLIRGESESSPQPSTNLNNHITISHLPSNRMAPEPRI